MYRVPVIPISQFRRGGPRKMVKHTHAQTANLVTRLQPSRFCWQLSVSLWAMLHFCHLCPWCLSFLGPSSTFGLQWGGEVCELCWVPAFSPERPRVEWGNGQQHIRVPFSFTLEPRQTLIIIIGPNVQLILGQTEVLAEAEVTFQFHWEYKMTFWNFKS